MNIHQEKRKDKGKKDAPQTPTPVLEKMKKKKKFYSTP
jgi:hypothetical protein